MSAPRKPKRLRPGTGHAEGVNEAPALLDAERVDIEKPTPAERRSSVEAVPKGRKEPPVFEEWGPDTFSLGRRRLAFPVKQQEPEAWT